MLESGWERYGAGLHKALSALQRLDLEEAAGHADALVAELGQHPGGGRAEKLTQAFRAASTFLGRFEVAVANGTVTFPQERSRLEPRSNGLEEDLAVLGFHRDGPEAGLMLNRGRRSRPRQHLVPLAELRAEDWVALTPSTDASAQEQRAFLTIAALLDHVREGKAYLGRIRADRDDSGTGERGYGLDAAVMEDLLARLQEEAWAESLGRELRAGIRLVQGMRALSENRPRAGAAHLEGLLEEYPRSIVVQALR